MENIEIQQNSNKLSEFIYNKFIDNKLDNNALIQQIELMFSLLNLKTPSQYAKENNMSYNGVKNFRTIIKISNVKFVIDNE